MIKSSSTENIRVNIRLKPSNIIDERKNNGCPWLINQEDNSISLKNEFRTTFKKPTFSKQYGYSFLLIL